MFYKIRDFIRRHFIGYRPSDMPCIDYLEIKGVEKMKIIELLNRIAKDEGIPIKIKFKDKTWEWNSGFYDYRCKEDNHRYLVEDLETEDLNRTCEEIPLKEDKKIEKLEYWVEIPYTKEGEYLKQGFQEQAKFNENIYFKINEIIDKLNKEE